MTIDRLSNLHHNRSYDILNFGQLIAGHNQTFPYVNNSAGGVEDNISMDTIKGAFHSKLSFYTTKTFNWKTVAYRLREAFGLSYDGFAYEPSALKRLLSRVNNMMPWETDREKLSKCEAEWLDKSRFFNPNQPFFDKPPTIDLKGLPVDAIGSRRFQFEVADEDGMHQAQLFVSKRIWSRYSGWTKEFHEACRLLNGEKAATVEFEVTDTAVKGVRLQMIDMYGNIAWREFKIK